MNYFSLGAEEQPMWHYCTVHNSSVAQCRSSKAKSEEAGITRRWYHQSQLTMNTWFSIYRIIIINANSYSQYLTSKQVLGLRIFLTQPGRSLNAGYSWPGVFLLGASGRTGRFFTQLLFHNPHSAAIRQIHFIWQWKTKTKTEEDWPFQQINRSLMHIYRSMVFLTRVNRFTCNICLLTILAQ